MAEASAGDVGQPIECLKMKLGGLLTDTKRERLEAAACIINKILCRATLLLKLWYLGQAAAVEIDAQTISLCFSIVQGATRVPRGRKDGEGNIVMSRKSMDRHGLFVTLKATYDTQLRGHCDPPYLTNNLSISLILAEAANQLVTNFTTNVVHHFDTYVKTLVHEELADPSLKGAQKTAQRRELGKVAGHLLYGDECPVEHVEWASAQAARLPVVHGKASRDVHIQRNPWVYMRAMVDLVTHLECRRAVFEIRGRRLPSPFVLRRSAVPGSIRLTTGGLVHLFMDKEDVQGFAAYYEEKTGNKIHLKDKADLCSDFAKVHGRPPAGDLEDALFSTWKWRYLMGFDDSKKHRRALEEARGDVTWRFCNCAYTDGVSISLCVTPESFLRVMDIKARGERSRARKKQAAAKKQEFPTVDAIDLALDKVVALDPGKKQLATLSDGIRRLALSRGAREAACGAAKMKATRWHVLNKLCPEAAQAQEDLRSCDSRSCIPDVFLTYARGRMLAEGPLGACYARPVFRNHRFRAYVRRKSWVQKSVNHIIECFASPCAEEPRGWMTTKAAEHPVYSVIIAEARSTQARRLVIAYGNWGRTPNLRGNIPTPGIGLRRIIHQSIPTFTQAEAYTSQTCPCCHSRSMEHAELLESHRKVHEKHSLLRCANDACQRTFFHRDVVGSLNILYKAHHWLLHRAAPLAFR